MWILFFTLFSFLFRSCHTIGHLTDRPLDEGEIEVDSGTTTEEYRCDYIYVEESDGWYKIHEMPMNYTDAYMVCIRERAVLASPMDEDYQYSMLRVMSVSNVNVPPRGLRTGYSKIKGGHFLSPEGNRLTDAVNLKWDYFQPDNINDSEHCINMRPPKKDFPNGSIADEDCSMPAPFMCYRGFQFLPHTECGTIDGYIFFDMENITEKYNPCFKYYTEKGYDEVDYLTATKNCMGDKGHLALHVTKWGSREDIKDKDENPFFFHKYFNHYWDLVWTGYTSNYYTYDGGDDWVAFPSDYPRERGIEEYYLNHYYPMFDKKYAGLYYQYYENRYFCSYLDGWSYGIINSQCNIKRPYLCERPKHAATDCEVYKSREKEMEQKIRKINQVKEYRCDYTFSKEGYGWYKLHTVPLNFTEARLVCKYEGGMIASPNFRAQKAEMLRIMARNNVGFEGVLTGINAFVLRQYFHSLEGYKLDDIEHEWDCDQPDNILNKQQCIYLRPNGKLSDEDCSDKAPFICYKEYDPKLIAPSSSVCGTSDVAYAKPDNAKFQDCYKLHYVRRNWYHASLACAAEGGALTVYDSREEFEYITRYWYIYPPTADRKVAQYFMGFTFYIIPTLTYEPVMTGQRSRLTWYYIGASKDIFGKYQDLRWINGRLFYESRIFDYECVNIETGTAIDTYPWTKHKFCMTQKYKLNKCQFNKCEDVLPFTCKMKREILMKCPKPKDIVISDLTKQLYSAQDIGYA